MPEPPHDDPVIEPGTYPHPLLELDAAGRVRWCNLAARRLASPDAATRDPGDPTDSDPAGADPGLDAEDPGSLRTRPELCRRILPDDVEGIAHRCLESGEDVDGVIASAGDRTLSWSFRPVASRNSVAGFGFDVTHWKESEFALRRKDDLLEAVGSAARVILGSPDGRVPADEVLQRLGRATGVSRVYLFQNHTTEEGRLLASQVAEWTQPHVEPQIDNPELQDVPYEEAGMARWAGELAMGRTLAGTLEEFPPEEQALLRAQDILSLVVTPVLVEGELWGFMGFDDCEVPRSWSRAELEILRAAADTVAAAIERQEALEALEESREQLRHVQRMEAVGRLAGGIAHDFNNLLTGILAHAEILLEELDAPHPARADADEIRKSALRAAALTRQLLAFSRKQAIRPSRVELTSVVAEIEELIRRLIGENIRVDTRVESTVPAVWADPGQVEQVIMNLVVNARDAMPDGGEITLAARESDLGREEMATRGLEPDRRYVLLAVADTGIGMDPRTRSKAFEPFFTTKQSGTGMGLSIIYGIARQSGGSAWIDSTPGEGTRVTVALPVPGEEVDDGGTPGRDDEDSARPSGDETILLVEDDEAVRGVTSRILTRAGYRVLEASSAEEGLARARSRGRTIDLLVTDVGLPDRSGTELAKDIQAVLPSLPILFISGFPGQRSPDLPLADEPLDFLPKPFTHEQLLQRVRERLDDGSSSR